MSKRKVRVINEDCRNFLRGTDKMFDFIFADPPFNIGREYSDYEDNLSGEEYTQFTRQWIKLCCQRCRGILCLHGPDDLVLPYLTLPSQEGFMRIAWVNWHYRFGQCGRSNWINTRCHCLIYAAYDEWTWNPDEVLVESDRATKYGDKRVHETERGGQRLPGTVWGVPSDGPYWGRVQGNSRERRRNHDNQLPEVYLERLLRAYTNPGDTVFDPFAGSGTTAVVCKSLNRRCVTTEISYRGCQSIRRRLARGSVRVSPSYF